MTTARCLCFGLIVLTFSTMAAPARADDPLIGGQPLSEWRALLRGDDHDQKLLAAWALAQMGTEAAPAVPALVELLADDDPVLRATTVGALAAIGPGAAEALPHIQALAENDPSPEVRAQAEMALMDLITTAPVTGGTAVAEPVLPAADPKPTLFVQPLRDHQAALNALQARIEALARTQPGDNAEARQWATDLKAAGNDGVAETQAFINTLHNFLTSRTRRGLTEEFDLVNGSVETITALVKGLQVRTEFDIEAYLDRQELAEQAAEQRRQVLTVLAREVDKRLETEGMVELLATGGLAAVRDAALRALRDEAQSEMERITQQELGIAFHDAASLRSALRQRGRDMVRRKVTQLLFRVTGNEIVVELVGGVLVRWIEGDLWPKLKEALRNKGNLDGRTETSLASLERARMRLWALPETASIDDVEAMIRNAQGSWNATRYLIGDLQRAGRQDLLDRMAAAKQELARAVTITRARFLLDKLEKLRSLEPKEQLARSLHQIMAAMVASIEIPPEDTEVADTGDTPAEGTPTREVERFEFPPRYLVHIIETGTAGGPVEKDVWILHPEPPNADGIVLTADGYGGVFINKADAYSGPYTSNYQVAPVLVGLGVPGVWLGNRYIDANPEIWGGGN